MAQIQFVPAIKFAQNPDKIEQREKGKENLAGNQGFDNAKLGFRVIA